MKTSLAATNVTSGCMPYVMELAKMNLPKCSEAITNTCAQLVEINYSNQTNNEKEFKECKSEYK